MHIRTLSQLALAASLAAASLGAQAASYTFTFDDVNSSTLLANSSALSVSSGVTFNNATLVGDPDGFGGQITDVYGNAIPGATSHWEIDPSYLDASVVDPSYYVRATGSAASGLALDANYSPILVSFGSVGPLASFSMALDGSGERNNWGPNAALQFVDATGHVVQTVGFNQGIASAVVTVSSISASAVGVILPNGKLYDNVSVSSVPEPESVALLLTGLGIFGLAAARRRG
jgi:hypothetical protein